MQLFKLQNATALRFLHARVVLWRCVAVVDDARRMNNNQYTSQEALRVLLAVTWLTVYRQHQFFGRQANTKLRIGGRQVQNHGWRANTKLRIGRQASTKLRIGRRASTKYARPNWGQPLADVLD